MGFPDGSEGKASACNAGDPGLIPGLGRSSGEGNCNPLQYSCLVLHGWRSLVGYSPWGRKESDTTERFHFFKATSGLVKNMPSLDLICGLGRSLGEEMATHSSILPGEFHGQRSLEGYSPWGRKRVGHDLVTKWQQQHHHQSLMYFEFFKNVSQFGLQH